MNLPGATLAESPRFISDRLWAGRLQREGDEFMENFT